jgi:hypothetical protein
VILPQGIDARLEHQSGWSCPKCGENKTSAWRDGPKLVLHCWRVSCNYNRELIVGNEPLIRATPGLTRFDRPTRTLSKQASEWMHKSFQLTEPAMAYAQWRQVEGEKAIWMPIFGPNREQRGGVYRRYDGRTPKALTYREESGPLQCWYWQDEAPTVIVEDQPSALRLWQYGYCAIALLGTALTDDKVRELLNYRYGPIRLALDRDAYAKAIKYRKRYGEPFTPVLILRDVKDMTRDELREAFPWTKQS